jgi:hypothetical protein
MRFQEGAISRGCDLERVQFQEDAISRGCDFRFGNAILGGCDFKRARFLDGCVCGKNHQLCGKWFWGVKKLRNANTDPSKCLAFRVARCYMYFQPKNSDLGKFWSVLQWYILWPFGQFSSHLAYIL